VVIDLREFDLGRSVIDHTFNECHKVFDGSGWADDKRANPLDGADAIVVLNGKVVYSEL
jgi:hypothetical protein